MADINFQADLQVDKNRLDEELLGQAQRMFYYNSQHAQAMHDRDRAKQALDVARANTDAAVRESLTASGAKFTEAVVDGQVRTNPYYIRAQDAYLKSEYEVNLLMGAVMAMNARRSMLESLVRLYLSGYWSEPRVPGGEEIKADAAQAGTEASIQRSQKVPIGAAMVGPEPGEEPLLNRPAPVPRPTPRVPPKA